jgi:DNA mismatch repair protein MutL
MLEVTPLESARPDLPSIRVYGYTGAPHLNRNTRSHIMLFVNGRYIQDASLSYAVSQAYHTLVPPDRYPVAVLMISLDPGDVDVNVHPTKAEVRFRSPDAVFSAVQRAVRRVVMARSGVPLAGLGESKAANEPAPWRTAVPSSGANQLDLDLPPYDAGRHSRQVIDQEAEADSQPSAMAPETDRPETRPRSLPPMRVIGQAAATYLIAEGPAGLYLVDQHAAHERILYERFMHDQAKHRPVAQHTLNAVTLQLPPEAVRLLEESLEGLHKVGFEIEPFGGNTIRVRAIPAVLADRDPEEAVRVLLDDLEVGEEPAASTQEARIILRVCKAAAVKAGQTLSYEEMRELMRQLERCESPRTCPHGRPTMIHISAAQLAKEFGRT